MLQEVRLWEIAEDDRLHECALSSLDLEARLETWLARDISILAPQLMVIGRQVETAFGGIIDLLCVDRAGNLVVVELKRDKTPREITAQCLDYASWIKDLSGDAISEIARSHLGALSLDEAFRQRFGEELPEAINENHSMLVVASRIDPASERIIKYLNTTYGVDINAVTFHYFRPGSGRELLARVFLIDPSDVEYQTLTKRPSKRRPNLTYEELEELAEQNGVDALYRRFVEGVEPHFQKHTTRSSLGFAAMLEASRKTVFSVLPGESTATDGLRFQVYIERLKELFGLSDEDALSLIPQCREPWKYYESADADLSGFQGYFVNQADIDRFVRGLAGRATAG